MCFCFWKPAYICGFNVGWMDYELTSISSETKYFAGDNQDQENKLSTGLKYFTNNFISTLERQQ